MGHSVLKNPLNVLLQKSGAKNPRIPNTPQHLTPLPNSPHTQYSNSPTPHTRTHPHHIRNTPTTLNTPTPFNHPHPYPTSINIHAPPQRPTLHTFRPIPQAPLSKPHTPHSLNVFTKPTHPIPKNYSYIPHPYTPQRPQY